MCSAEGQAAGGNHRPAPTLEPGALIEGSFTFKNGWRWGGGGKTAAPENHLTSVFTVHK